MKIKDMYTYDVKQGEVVNFEITPHKVGVTVSAVVGNKEMEKVRNDTQPVFRFPVTEPVGNVHIARLKFTFPDGTPNDARFDIVLWGSLQPPRYKVDPVKIGGALQEPNFTFRVVK